MGPWDVLAWVAAAGLSVIILFFVVIVGVVVVRTVINYPGKTAETSRGPHAGIPGFSAGTGESHTWQPGTGD